MKNRKALGGGVRGEVLCRPQSEKEVYDAFECLRGWMADMLAHVNPLFNMTRLGRAPFASSGRGGLKVQNAESCCCQGLH